MSALQRVLIDVGLAKRVLVDMSFAKGIGKCRPSKRVLIDDGFGSASEVFTRR